MCVPCAVDTGGLVTTEEYQWIQDPGAQTKGYHAVLPHDPSAGARGCKVPMCVPCAGDTGGLVTTEEYQWAQDPDAQTKGYHPVLPRDPEGGIPWLTVRPCVSQRCIMHAHVVFKERLF